MTTTTDLIITIQRGCHGSSFALVTDDHGTSKVLRTRGGAYCERTATGIYTLDQTGHHSWAAALDQAWLDALDLPITTLLSALSDPETGQPRTTAQVATALGADEDLVAAQLHWLRHQFLVDRLAESGWISLLDPAG